MQRLGSRLPSSSSPLFLGDVEIGNSVAKDGTLTIFGGKLSNKAVRIKDGTTDFLTIDPDNTRTDEGYISIIATPESASTASIIQIAAEGSAWADGSFCLTLRSEDSDAGLLAGYSGTIRTVELDRWGVLTLSSGITFKAGGGIDTTSNGDLTLIPNGTGITIVGDAGSTSHSLANNDDLFVAGSLEVDGVVHFDDEVNFQGATLTGSTVTHDAYVTLSVGGVAKKFMLVS